MGQNKRGQREYSREQRLIHENQQLKKQISSLRKQLSKVDLERNTYVREIIERNDQLEDKYDIETGSAKLARDWKCRKCGKGEIEICVYHKPDGAFYYRQCNCCEYRTRSQKHGPNISGIMQPPKPKL